MKFPFTSRARAERNARILEEALARADERVEQQDKAAANVRKLLSEMHDQHKPYPGDWARLGNYAGGRTEWWCTACRTSWPCAPWRQVRRIHSATYGPRMPEPVPEMEMVMRPKRNPNTPDAA